MDEMIAVAVVVSLLALSMLHDLAFAFAAERLPGARVYLTRVQERVLRPASRRLELGSQDGWAQ